MLAAIACWRRLAASSARPSTLVVTASIPSVMSIFSLLDNQFSVHGAGRLDGPQNRNDVARIGFQPGLRLHQVGHRDAARRHVTGAVVFRHIDMGIGHDRSTNAWPRLPDAIGLR